MRGGSFSLREERDARLWGTLCHLTALLGPILNIIVPLIIWLTKKDQFPSVNEQGKESLNFQISLSVYTAIASFLLVTPLGWALLAVMVLADIALVILASIEASQGRIYHYPLSIQFIP